jgi:hypothetical protein
MLNPSDYWLGNQRLKSADRAELNVDRLAQIELA